MGHGGREYKARHQLLALGVLVNYQWPNQFSVNVDKDLGSRTEV